MREMEQLPPDQRAVLSLVLTQEKGYAEVASLLGISERSVRERAHAALDALAARGPANGASAPVGSPPRRVGSRTGGAILLGAILAAVVAAAILLSSGGGKGSGQTAGQAPHSTRGSTSAESGTSGVHLEKQLSLSPADPSSRASGEGIVVSKGNHRAFYVKAHGLRPSAGFFYAVWLYNSQSESVPLGKSSVGANGVLEGGGPLTGASLASFHKLVITRETSNHPTVPGPIVLSAPLG